MHRTFRLIDAAALSAVGLWLGACAESSAPTAPKDQFRTELITCHASVSARTLDCAASQPQAARGVSFDLVLGGQGALVRLASSGNSYNSGTFSSNVTLENLIAQVMNSADGTTPDAGGIKVFFNGDPTVTGGTGSVSVANPDGTGTFLGAAEPYFLYSNGAVLASGATTSAKLWQFTVPSTVTTFTFQVFVTTRLPNENPPIVALGLSRSPSALTIAPGGSGTTTVTLTVGTAGSGNVTVDFSSCPVAQRAVWLAAQDGTNPWTRVTGASDVYNFTIGSGGGGLAYVVLGAGGVPSVTVQYTTQAEFTAGTLVLCPPATGKTINGSVANAGAFDNTTVSLGGRSASVFSSGSPAFQLTDVPDGPQDLVAYDHSLVGGAESAIIRRSQNIADNGTITTLDFASVEAFTPATATITLNGLLGDEQYVQQEMVYQVAANCATAFLYNGDISGATFTAFGIPSGQQQPTDFHGLLVLASTSTGIRLIQQYNHSLVARTLTLGAVMPTPTITTLATPPAYKRLQAVYTLPTDYERSTSFGYQDGANKSVTISATFGYLGGPSTTLALPDFSALSGWDNNWAPSSTSTGTWFVSGNGGSGSACTEGASVKAATVNGTY